MPRPIKTLYFIEGNGGGAITHTLTLAKQLHAENFSPAIAFFMDGPSVSQAHSLGLKATLIPRRFDLDFTLAWRLSRILKREEIDILHTHTITGNFYARWAAYLSPHRPIIFTTVHSFVIDEMKGQTKVTFRDWLRCKRDIYGQRFTQYFIAISRNIKDHMVENGIPTEKITVIENGVDIPDRDVCSSHRLSARSEFDLKPTDIAIGITGRLVPLKNHNFFLRIAQKLTSQIEHVKFIIIGDGILSRQLEETTKKMGLEKYVIFTGWRNDVLRLITALDIFVLCSLIEGLSISILEAMACAKPVVGTRTKGISDIVQDGQTGLLFSSDDLDGFVGGLTRLIQNKEWAGELGQNGRELVKKRFSTEAMMQKVSQLYIGASHL